MPLYINNNSLDKKSKESFKIIKDLNKNNKQINENDKNYKAETDNYSNMDLDTKISNNEKLLIN